MPERARLEVRVAPEPRRMRRVGSETVMGRFVRSLLLIALAVGATFATWPQLADLELTTPWVQIVSMRGLGAAIALFVALVLLLVRAGARQHRGYLSALAFIFMGFALANAAIVGIRGVFPGDLPKPESNQVRVVAWNTLGDEVSVEILAETADKARANVVVLPETTQAHAEGVAATLLDDYGRDFAVHTIAFDQTYKARSTSVLVERRLGDYQISDALGGTSVLPSVVLEPVDRGSRPTIVGIHSVSPVSGEMSQWRGDLAWLANVCAQPNTIVAGDANATLDHLHRVEGCSFSATQAGAGGLGSWPTTLPALLGAPVDLVLTSPDWRAIGYAVISDGDLAGSDHRPVAAVLIPSKE